MGRGGGQLVFRNEAGVSMVEDYFLHRAHRAGVDVNNGSTAEEIYDLRRALRLNIEMTGAALLCHRLLAEAERVVAHRGSKGRWKIFSLATVGRNGYLRRKNDLIVAHRGDCWRLPRIMISFAYSVSKTNRGIV